VYYLHGVTFVTAWCVLVVAGATIVNRPDEIQESDIGTGCGLFEVRKIGDE
jgi:hypothetical protein